MAESPSSSWAIRVTFGPAGSAAQAVRPEIGIELPCLAGEAQEAIFEGMEPMDAVGGVALYRRGGLVVGHAREAFIESTVEEDSRRLYERILATCGARHLYRIWN